MSFLMIVLLLRALLQLLDNWLQDRKTASMGDAETKDFELTIGEQPIAQ